MRGIIAYLLVLVTLAQADRDWSKVFPIHVNSPPHIPKPHGIPDPRITGGWEVVPNSHPYMAALLIPVSGGTAFCGGTLIARQTVLTAAHCVESIIGPVEVILGAHRIQEAEPSQVSVNSSGILIHPNWSSLLLRNDIALIRLPTPVALNNVIRTITFASDDSNTFEGHEATVAGWGRESDEATTIASALRAVNVPIITNSACSIPYLGTIQVTHICASGLGGRSSCNGDSGGPLVVGGQQVGIVSFGISFGCEAGWPSVYTRVSKFASWINANLI